MRLIQFLLLFISSLSAYTQNKDVELIKTERGNQVTFAAKSITRETIKMEFDITGNGFTTNVSMPAKIEVKGFEKKEVVTLTMGPAASYNVSYKVIKSNINADQSTASAAPVTPRPELNKGIVIFSKDGCTKCTFAKKNLTEKGKKYTTLNISTSEEDERLMWAKLKEAGFSGGSVQTPVIMVEGKVHFNMDLNLFLEDIK